jgi:hypothetical protein
LVKIFIWEYTESTLIKIKSNNMQENGIIKSGLIFLVLILVGILVFIFFFGDKYMSTQSQSDISQMPVAQSPETQIEGDAKLLGTIVELAQIVDSKDKRITLSSQRESGLVVEYKFFLSGEGTVGVDNVAGGERVAISFRGIPSTTDYIVAEKIEIMGEKQ